MSDYTLSKGSHTTAEDGRCAMESSCVVWTGRRDEKGYGRAGRRKAHRVAWETANGPIPTGLCVLHRCDNPPCCNPAHLFLGTQLDNVRDREAKGRGVAPPSRAKLTDAQVREMRRLYALGETQIKLAKKYPVSRGNLSKIVNGRLYSHVH